MTTDTITHHNSSQTEDETPRTDSAEYDNFNGTKVTPYVDAEFARQLERELTSAYNSGYLSPGQKAEATYEQVSEDEQPPTPPTVSRATADKLRDALDAAYAALCCDNTHTDSYGVDGSDWGVCDLCEAEDRPGVFSKGIPHEPTCLFYKIEQALAAYSAEAQTGEREVEE